MERSALGHLDGLYELSLIPSHLHRPRDMRRTIAIIASAGVLALAGIMARHHFVRHDGPVDGVLSAGVESSTTGVEASDGSATPVDQVLNHEVPVEPEPSLELRFHTSADLWQFAENIHPAAKAGDPAAQYYLSRALKYCEDNFRFYFIRGNRRRTLDEAMVWASTRTGIDAEEAREVHARCSRLQETSHPFGTAEAWLTASKEKGFSLAMIDAARQLAAEAGVSGATEHVAMRDEAKQLALRALESKDPRVVFGMGDLAALFVGDLKKASQLQWVWRLAACKRGYDCGQDADWIRLQCRFDHNCQPYESGVDFIRRANSEDFDEIERLANDLNARLDAGDFRWPAS